MNQNAIIKKLVSRNMHANRFRNWIAITAIALTAILFTTVFTVGISMLSTAATMGGALGTGAQGFLIAFAAITLILCSGYLIIYNIFQISVTQEIQFYGLLKTLGATKAQIRRMVVLQAFRLCLIGIPIGLLVGYGIGAVLIPIVLVNLGSAAALSFNPLIFLGAALFSLATVFLSCAKPAAFAGQVAPVTAMKYVDGNYGKNTAQRTGNHVSTKTMARNNLMQNKKRTALVILSVSIGLILMNSFYVYQHSYDEEAYINGFLASNIVVNSKPAQEGKAAQGEITPQTLQDLQQRPEVTQSGALWYTETEVTLNPDVQKRLISYYEEPDSGQQVWMESNEDTVKQFQACKKTGKTTASVYGLDPFTADMGTAYVGTFDAEQFATGRYVIAFGIANNGEGSVHYAVGDKIVIAGKTYELMAMVDPPSTVRGNLRSQANMLEIDYAIHSRAFQESFGQVNAVSMFCNTKDTESQNALFATLANEYPQLEVLSRVTFATRFQSQTLAISAMGYALGIIMALIGTLNYANAMITTIIARKREFTMLESIGMTKQQLKKMLVTEGLYYLICSASLSLAGSTIVANTIIQESVSQSWVANYNFSLLPIAIIVPILIAFAIAIPLICFRNVNQQSLSDRLREAA